MIYVLKELNLHEGRMINNNNIISRMIDCIFVEYSVFFFILQVDWWLIVYLTSVVVSRISSSSSSSHAYVLTTSKKRRKKKNQNIHVFLTAFNRTRAHVPFVCNEHHGVRCTSQCTLSIFRNEHQLSYFHPNSQQQQQQNNKPHTTKHFIWIQNQNVLQYYDSSTIINHQNNQ